MLNKKGEVMNFKTGLNITLGILSVSHMAIDIYRLQQERKIDKKLKEIDAEFNNRLIDLENEVFYKPYYSGERI